MNAIPKELGSSHPVDVQLKVSRYDQAASLLVSLLILIGVSVALMFIIWLTQTLEFRQYKTIISPATGRQSTAGPEVEMATLGMAEMPELAEPQLAVELQAVTTAVSTAVAATEEIDTTSLRFRRGKPVGDSSDELEPNDQYQDEAEGIIPRWERWQIHWTSSSLPAYTRQLDYFKIELGAAGGQPMLDYAAKLSDDRPVSRKGTSQAEKRMYMTWKGGSMMKFDKALLARAGIPTADRVLMQFYPAIVENELASIEWENAKRHGHKDPKEFRKTYFGVRPKGRDFEFFVEDQQFRTAPPTRGKIQ